MKKYIIIDHPMAMFSDSDIVYREPESGDEDYNIFNSFKAAKESLLYALQEIGKETDEETKEDVLNSYYRLKNLSLQKYKKMFPKNFSNS